ncbi:21078_t:CDS:2, partial [Gigaspora rosea]
ITESYEPKIANFWLSRTEQEMSVKIENILSIIRWLAPEKISQSQYDLNTKYDHQCEMYSVPEIEQLVRSKKREKIMLDPSPIAQELFRIIKQAWNHIPSERPKVMNVLTALKEAYEKYAQGASPMIFPKHVSDNNIPSYNLSSNININEVPHED